MVLGLINYLLMRRTLAHVGSVPDERRCTWGQLGAVLARRGVGVRGRRSCCSTRRDRRALRVVAGAVDPGIFVYLIAKSGPRRARRTGGGADPDRRDDLVLHLLPADVDVADAVRAAQRRPGSDAVRRAPVQLDPGAVPGAQSDLDHAAQPAAGAGPTRAAASAARTCRSPRSSRSASSSVAIGLLHLRHQRRLRGRTARCRRGTWCGATACIRSANCWSAAWAWR